MFPAGTEEGQRVIKEEKMTLPYEACRSLKWAQEFLGRLIFPSVMPGIPKKVREEARRILHHYPFECEINRLYGEEATSEGWERKAFSKRGKCTKRS